MISIDVSEFSDADVDHMRKLYAVMWADESANPRNRRWCWLVSLALLEELEFREVVLRGLSDDLEEYGHGIGGQLNDDDPVGPDIRAALDSTDQPDDDGPVE